MSRFLRDVNRCRCGHDASDHELLPGHPDGAWECHGDGDKCECGKMDISRDRWA